MMGYGTLYNSLKKDDSWNSPTNLTLLGKLPLSEYKCPRACLDPKDYTMNYIAVIGSGTAWRKDGPVKLSDLPDGGSHAVVAVETVNSGVHWAEPRDLTVEEALDHMKTGKKPSISTAHTSVINVLFADGHVGALPAKMPLSLWKKILEGKMNDLDSLDWDESALDMVDVSVDTPHYEQGEWIIILSFVIWLLSVILLFRRAIKSRPTSMKKDVAGDAIS